MSVPAVAVLAAAPANQALPETLARADQLLLAGKPDEALQLLQPPGSASPGPAVEARLEKLTTRREAWTWPSHTCSARSRATPLSLSRGNYSRSRITPAEPTTRQSRCSSR